MKIKGVGPTASVKDDNDRKRAFSCWKPELAELLGFAAVAQSYV
jgi:hypothetical protein